jgi:hypothetical protein
MSSFSKPVLSLALICIVFSGSGRILGQSTEIQPQTTAERLAHFSETLSAPTRGGRSKKLAVEIDDWDFPLGDTEFDAPTDGPVIMQVRQGSLSARIDGVSKAYRTGDYWTIPAGAHVIISLPSAHDSAQARTIIAVPITQRRKPTASAP